MIDTMYQSNQLPTLTEEISQQLTMASPCLDTSQLCLFGLKTAHNLLNTNMKLEKLFIKFTTHGKFDHFLKDTNYLLNMYPQL